MCLLLLSIILTCDNLGRNNLKIMIQSNSLKLDLYAKINLAFLLHESMFTA